MKALKKTINKLFINPKYRLLTFVVLFAIVGVAVLLLAHATAPYLIIEPENGTKSGVTVCNDATASNNKCIQFGSTSSTGAISAAPTALTVVGTDDVSGAAVCIDNSANVPNVSSKVTACIQVNPNNTSQARFGTYDVINKVFYPVGSIWSAISNITSAGKVTSLTCASTNNGSLGLGPLGGSYYGEEASGNNVNFGTINATNHDCSTANGGSLSNSQWATPAIYCSSTAFQVSDILSYQAAVTARKPEICVKAGNYTYTSSMHTIGVAANTKVIGESPLQRPVFDSSALPAHLIINGVSQPQQTGSFSGLGDGLLANVIARGAQGDLNGVRNGTCPICGNGISGGEGIHLYNIKASNNMETGFHYAINHTGVIGLYILENSELSYNGSNGDNTWAAGGMKTINGGTINNNVVINNNGPGLWCDGNDQNHSECHGGVWNVKNNYIAGNFGDGVHFEIVFKNPTTGQSTSTVTVAPIPPPWGVIQNNVINCNNTGNKSFMGGVSVFASQTLVSNNIFDNRQNATKFTHTCTDGHKQAVYVYNDARVPPYTNNITVIHNALNGDTVNCTSGTAIVCAPNP